MLPLFLLALGQTTKAPLATRYVNARYGYSVEIPSSLLLRSEGQNGDGRTYLSKDARTELLVYGSQELLDENGKPTDSLSRGYRRWIAQARKKGPAPKVAKLGPNFFAASWREGRRLLFVRTIKLAEGYATVEITYPIDRRSAVDAAVARTLASLKSIKR